MCVILTYAARAPSNHLIDFKLRPVKESEIKKIYILLKNSSRRDNLLNLNVEDTQLEFYT